MAQITDRMLNSLTDEVATLRTEVERLQAENDKLRRERQPASEDEFLIVETGCIERYSKRDFLPTPMPAWKDRQDAAGFRGESAPPTNYIGEEAVQYGAPFDEPIN